MSPETIAEYRALAARSGAVPKMLVVDALVHCLDELEAMSISDEAPTKPQTPDAHRRYSSGSMQAVRPGGLAERVGEILEKGKTEK